MLYAFYVKHSQDPWIATLFFAAWKMLQSMKHIVTHSFHQNIHIKKQAVKVAVICDQMTYENLKTECSLIYITPWNWRCVIKKYRPDILFCESAWSGIDSAQCWARQIYRNHNVLFDNRRSLLRVVKGFKKERIPTVFWNKEDPTFFRNRQYDFVDTALHFDYIFTTASECVEKYKNQGHHNVEVLPFCFAPKMFNPLNSKNQQERAVFAGSWYNYLPERCKSMRALFELMEKNGIPYDIYDRYWNTQNPKLQFPPEYQSHILPSVSYAELPEITARYRYVININTVSDSDSMFARRVYEMIAQNHIIVSNRSVGMERQFPNGIWYLDEKDLPAEITGASRQNLEFVFSNFTTNKWLARILEAVGMQQKTACDKLMFLLLENAKGSEKPTVCYRKTNGQLLECQLNMENLLAENYVAIISCIEDVDTVNWDFLLNQFLYLPEKCGIRWGNPQYEILEDNDHNNCLFPADLLADWDAFWTRSIKKLYI